MSPGTYTLLLTDTNGNWYSNSVLKLILSGSLFNTYRLDSGSSITYQFTITSVSSFSYPRSSYILPTSKLFIATPSISGSVSSCIISSGSLPYGLSLNSTTCIISGTPTSVNQYSVTIKAISTTNYITYSISFSIIDNPSSCSSSKVLVTFNRITKVYAIEENFKIYQGSTTSGSLVYTQPTIFNDQSYTWNTCLSTGTYTMLLTDSSSDGWSSNSVLSFSYNAYNAIGNYRLLSGSSISFQFSVLYPPFYYPYTNFILLVNQQYLIPPFVADSSSYAIT